jgi:argininosuccinate lyase
MKKLWGGRFVKPTDPQVEKYTSSIAFDKILASYDVLGSIAHAKMLGETGIISKKDSEILIGGLSEILDELGKGKFKFDLECEDIHTNILNALEQKVGNVAFRLHTARSRNDQVSLDVRMYCMDELNDMERLIIRLQKALVNLADQNFDVAIPGYTHQQRAQPVLLSHHILAYVNMFERDKQRLSDAYRRVDEMPLGSCALCGTSLPINRRLTAKLLGFSRISENSIDAVSDRDFIIEILSDLALVAMHLSRMSEDFILWSTSEFGFIDIDESFCTGSSIMPQKKNPDVLEIMRGRTGNAYGDLMSVLVTMKSLPLSYDRDMQMDKEPLFNSVDCVKQSLAIMIELLKGIKVNQEAAEHAVGDEFLLATDIAEYLVRKDVSSKEAHEIVGRIVAYCIKEGKRFSELSMSEFEGFSRAFGKDVYGILNVKSSISLKRSFGGTSPGNVARSVKVWKKRLEMS